MARILKLRPYQAPTVLAPLRVFIVDDSPAIRALLRRVLEIDGDMVVVGEAADAYEARAGIKAQAPDVVTLDIDMPKMDGLDFLSRLMSLRPMPVVMVSSQTTDGSGASLEALRLGAVDCLNKRALHSEPGAASVRRTVRRAGRVVVQKPKLETADRAPAKLRQTFEWGGRTVLIGASTGGVEALEQILMCLPAQAPPLIIVQHMPPAFLEHFVDRLDRKTAIKVTLAHPGAKIRPGHAFVAPGGAFHLTVERRGAALGFALSKGPPVEGHCPAVDALFTSAVPFASQIVGVLLTGMGRDGAEGLTQLHAAGAVTIGQDAETSTVYGMPQVAARRGALTKVLPLDAIADGILAATEAKRPLTAGAGKML